METDDDIDTLQNKLAALQVEHRDLDAVIERLSVDSPVDELLMRRMKKRKLQLKDQITVIERMLTPDELA